MYVGIDHSTTGVKTVALHDDGSYESFLIERHQRESKWSFLDELSNYVDFDNIDMVANGFSMGNNFNTITDISSLDNRGVIDYIGLGHGFGTGTQVFDELVNTDLPCIAYPGIHQDLDCLDPYFKHYSSLTGADKVAMTRYAQEIVSAQEGVGNTFISACVSSSAMATIVRNGTLRGAFHWLGLIHGHVDTEMLRELRDSNSGYRDVFMRSGLLFRSGEPFEKIRGVPDEDLLKSIRLATLQHVYSLVPFTFSFGCSLDKIVLSGRLSRVTSPINMQSSLEESLSRLAPVHICSKYSTALGAAYIARDAAQGANDVLGIPVETTPITEKGQL
ncbi:hypothetical protein [Natrialba aegyptia]|uniref:hypothetical protein n=1 Tax=Natrialba aegyptia TaxID=129789 RepID=UPI0012682430|nr:hypothetical protein [Natrialba aegyptia]